MSLSPSYLFPAVAIFPVVASVFYALALAARASEADEGADA